MKKGLDDMTASFNRLQEPEAIVRTRAVRPVVPGAAGGVPSFAGSGGADGTPIGVRPRLRLLAAGLTGLAGLALIGYVLLEPAGSDEAFGWEPVTEEARLAVERPDGAPSASVSPQPASSEANAAPAAASHPDLSAGSSPSPVASGDSPRQADQRPASGGLLDLNRASAAELDNLPGIGPSKANAIVAHRERHGPFRTVDQLLEVKGIGPKLLERLRPLVTVGGEDPSAESESNGR